MSDSHGCNHEVSYVLEKEKDADLFLHCGDICVDKYVFPEVIAVSGNNDYYDYPMQRVLNVEGHRLIMFHSHQFSFVRAKEKMIQRAKENDCDIICYGHTHMPMNKVEEGIRIINPGSLYHNRDGSPISYAILNVTKDKVEAKIVFIENE